MLDGETFFDCVSDEDNAAPKRKRFSVRGGKESAFSFAEGCAPLETKDEVFIYRDFASNRATNTQGQEECVYALPDSDTSPEGGQSAPPAVDRPLEPIRTASPEEATRSGAGTWAKTGR